MPFSTTAGCSVLEKHTRLPLSVAGGPASPGFTPPPSHPGPRSPALGPGGLTHGQGWLSSHGSILVLTEYAYLINVMGDMDMKITEEFQYWLLKTAFSLHPFCTVVFFFFF